MPIVDHKKKFKEVLKIMNQKKIGVVVIIKNKFINGLLTDGDLRRELKSLNKGEDLNKYVTKNPHSVNLNMPASKALAIMNEKKVTSLLVVSDQDLKKRKKKLKGIIHIHSLLQSGIKWWYGILK